MRAQLAIAPITAAEERSRAMLVSSNVGAAMLARHTIEIYVFSAQRG